MKNPPSHAGSGRRRRSSVGYGSVGYGSARGVPSQGYGTSPRSQREDYQGSYQVVPSPCLCLNTCAVDCHSLVRISVWFSSPCSTEVNRPAGPSSTSQDPWHPPGGE